MTDDGHPNPIGDRASLAVLAWVYVAALAVGTGVVLALDDWHPLTRLLVADLAATLTVFAASLTLDNTSVYDPYWSVAPFAIAVWWAAVDGVWSGSEIWVLALLGIWGARLTGNFLRGWPGLQHEDWRYDAYRRHGPGAYWFISLVGLHGVPTLVVFAAMLPVWGITDHPAPMGWLSWVGIGGAFVSIGIEAIADQQLHRYRATDPAPDAVLDTGLWAWSRNPNYLGEMGFWWSLWLIACGASWTHTWTVVGPMLVTALFVFISIPLKEARMAERRSAAWKAYTGKTPRLLSRRPGPQG